MAPVSGETAPARFRLRAQDGPPEEVEDLKRLREELERLRAIKRAADAEASDLTQKSMDAQEETESLQKRYAAQIQKTMELKETFKEQRELTRKAEESAGFGKRSIEDGGRALGGEVDLVAEAASDEQFVKSLVDMELAGLASLRGEERTQAQRRLQAKWHPDRNSHSVGLATKVFQEMQQHANWA